MNFAQFLSNLTTGEGLALIGAALAVVLPGMGSAKAVGSVGESLNGLLSEDPSKFGKAFLLQALPGVGDNEQEGSDKREKSVKLDHRRCGNSLTGCLGALCDHCDTGRCYATLTDSRVITADRDGKAGKQIVKTAVLEVTEDVCHGCRYT